MSIDDDKKRENASIENSLMKKVKIKNNFEGEGGRTKKIGISQKKPYTERVKERMGEYYEEEPFKIHSKRKRHKYGEISNVIKKTMKMLQEKNRQRHKQ